MKHVLFLMTLALWANSSFASDDFSAINKYVIAAKNEVGFPSGTAIAIVKDGKVVYEGYFGYANIKEKQKVTDKTAFYLASITKPFFALSTLLMEDQGDISSFTSMGKMFSKLDFPHIDNRKVQLKHLLSHSHGLDNLPLQETLAFTGLHDKAQRHKLAIASKYDPNSSLGEYQYSNLGYNLTSIWVEDYYQKDWQEKLNELVYQPLKMNRTSSYMSDSIKRGFSVARPYALNVKSPLEVLPFEKNNLTMQAAGGTISTAKDMARFLIAQLNNGYIDGEQVFPANVIEKSHQQLAVNNLKYRDFIRKGYAWGWYIGPYKGENMYHHFGGTPGTHTHASFMIKHNIGLVILNNESMVSSKISNAIADIAYSILLKKDDVDEKTNFHIVEMQEAWKMAKSNIQDDFDSVEKRDASRNMELSLEKSKYAGVFHNPLWGNLTIELLETNEFKVTLGELEAIATAAKLADELRIQLPVMGGKIVSFKIGKGEVQMLEVLGINHTGENFTKI
jgi:CubicO group peptidase (beta-lactamase class C family)